MWNKIRLTFFKTRFARYKKVKLVKCPISRHILAKKRKIHLKNDFSQFWITYHWTNYQFEFLGAKSQDSFVFAFMGWIKLLNRLWMTKLSWKQSIHHIWKDAVRKIWPRAWYSLDWFSQCLFWQSSHSIIVIIITDNLSMWYT